MWLLLLRLGLPLGRGGAGQANWTPMKNVTVLLGNLLEAFVTPSTDSPINSEIVRLARFRFRTVLHSCCARGGGGCVARCRLRVATPTPNGSLVLQQRPGTSLVRP
jgi:hypothetical protein